MVVTSSLYEANKMYRLMSSLNDNTLLFPMDDFLTSEALAISPDLMIKRLETINSLVSEKKSIVITNLMGYLRFLPLKNNYCNQNNIKYTNYFYHKELVEKKKEGN